MVVILIVAALLGALGFVIFTRAGRRAPNSPLAARVGGIVLMVIAGLLATTSVVRVVQPGYVAVATMLGSVREGVFDEGLHIVNPLYSFRRYSIRRAMFDFSGANDEQGSAGGEIVAISSDAVPLTIDVGLPIRLNAAMAWKVFQRIGVPSVVSAQLVIPAARASVRDATAEFDWRNAATVSRNALAHRIEKRFRELIETDLIAVGFSEEEARSTLTVLPVQLRKILPPQKVLNAVSEKVAAQEDLERQKTLTQIAEEEARRRQNEGRGVKNLFTELPAGFAPSEIREVLAAIADKTRAEAMMKAVETGQVQILIRTERNPPSPPTA